MKEYYDADCLSANSLSQTINTWLKDVSDGKTDMPAGMLSEETRVAMMSYMGFKAKWKTPFLQINTDQTDFYSADGSSRKVNMMRNCLVMPYYKDEFLRAIQLRYAGSDYYAAYVMPENDYSLNYLFDHISDTGWESICGGMSDAMVSVGLPVVEVASETDFAETFKSIGINKVFSENADFSRIAPEDNLYLKDIRQKSSIRFSEKGTEGTSVSSAALDRITDTDPDEEPKILYFIANRPFLFVIGQKSTGALLYIGAYC